jgi:DNA-binding ferritin-like protein
MNEFAQLISTLLASRTQAHIFHWQVEGPGSNAAHKA